MKILDGVVLISPAILEVTCRVHMGLKHKAGEGVRSQTASIACSGFEAGIDSDSASFLRAIKTEMIEPMIIMKKMKKKTKLVIFLFLLKA